MKDSLGYVFLNISNEGALQAVGGVMRQTGDLPDWLITGAIRKRRSESNADASSAIH
ncbi:MULTISPECIES: hypothetical protein [Sporosarcina]|uniref:hypothetical protein n=1 Tax=Sporosarcina TaxID=1569 RepID=UPI0003058D28|nr:hypothetical protein [Sporosarcina newyorkensis]